MSRPYSSPSIWIYALAFFTLVLAGSPGCGSDPSSPGEPKDANVSVETSNRQHATIGAAGGTLVTTNNAGVAFTLDIPPGALTTDVDISITPVTSIKGLPYSGGLEAAVQLGPSGLTLVAPAVLTIETTASLTGDQRLVGFSYQGDATSFELEAGAQVAPDTIRVLVPHFSGSGAAVAVPDDIRGLLLCDSLSADVNLSLQTLCARPGDRDSFWALMRLYLNQIVAPAIDAGTGDDLRFAVARYIQWDTVLDTFSGYFNAAGLIDPDLADDIDAVEALIAQKLAQAISVEKERCTFTGQAEPLTRIFEFYYQAAFLGLGTFENGLDEASVLDGICASVVITQATLADPLPLNQDRSLDVDFALEINGVRQNGGMFEATVTGVAGADVQHPNGRTSAQGRYTTVVRRTLADGAIFNIQGCLLLPLFSFNSTSVVLLTEVPICTDFELFRGGNAEIETDFQTSVLPNAAAPLHVHLTRLVAPGQTEPLEGAVVKFTASGGTVSPTQGTSDANGDVSTVGTASGSTRTFEITILVSKDGVNLGSKVVQAVVGDVGIVLIENRGIGGVQVDVSGPCDSTISVDSFNRSDLVPHHETRNAAISCTDLQNFSSSSFGSLVHNSDPGIAADLRSAVMTISNSETGTASTDNNFSNSGFEVSFQGVITFRIQGEPKHFEIDASVEIQSPGGTRVQLGAVTTDNPPPLFDFQRQFGDGLDRQQQASGTLLPGVYYVGCETGCFRLTGSGGPNFSGSVFNQVTLRLTTPVPVTASSRR